MRWAMLQQRAARRAMMTTRRSAWWVVGLGWEWEWKWVDVGGLAWGSCSRGAASLRISGWLAVGWLARTLSSPGLPMRGRAQALPCPIAHNLLHVPTLGWLISPAPFCCPNLLVQNCDWEAHPAEMILSHTGTGKYVVLRQGLGLDDYGLVRHAGRGAGGGSERGKSARMVGRKLSKWEGLPTCAPAWTWESSQGPL